MRIGFIGAGKVAMAFGLYLRDRNQIVSGYFSRSNESAASAADLIKTEAFRNLEDLIASSDFIGITTPDDQISEVVSLLSHIAIQSPKVFFHMSGALASDVLYPLKSRGHQCFSLHPLQTISDPISGASLLEKCLFTMEGDSGPQIDVFSVIFDTRVMRVRSDQKTLYHAAACIASNYLYTLVNEAIGLMESAGFDRQAGFQALKPLMEGTLRNLEIAKPEEVLTGPIARGDVSTVESHLDAMAVQGIDNRVYKEMGLATLQLASKIKLRDPEKLRALELLLRTREDQNHDR